MADLLIGADPELFVVKGKRSRTNVSAHLFSKGTKEKPEPVAGGAIQVDGTALEFNITPEDNPKAFADRIEQVMSIMNDYLPRNHYLVAEPVAHYGHDYLATLPESAVELGCNPDFNAYTGKENPRPDAKMDFRTGSGHIHIGWNHLVGVDKFDVDDPAHRETCQLFVKELDASVGMACRMFDTDDTRRQLYGKAGAYRPKPYGLEYRVPSNAWLRDRRLMEWVFHNVKKAYDNLVKGKGFSLSYPTWAAERINEARGNYLQNMPTISRVLGQNGYDIPPGLKA